MAMLLFLFLIDKDEKEKKSRLLNRGTKIVRVEKLNNEVQ